MLNTAGLGWSRPWILHWIQLRIGWKLVIACSFYLLITGLLCGSGTRIPDRIPDWIPVEFYSNTPTTRVVCLMIYCLCGFQVRASMKMLSIEPRNCLLPG